MEVGPVEMIVLDFPGERADPGVVEAVAEVVRSGSVTLLDLVFITRTTEGEIRITDVDENLDETGLATLEVASQTLVSEDDLDVVRDSLEPGHSAAVIVYEHSWARKVGAAIRAAGGEVALHIQIPRDAVEAAVLDAESD